MEIQILFTLFKKKVISKWSIFKDSILYYPILFSIIVFVGFLVTSRIDESFDRGYNIDLPYFSSLIFTGSADSARSILSAIAGGWTTILGVAFSVTLITLQLSTSRYTSHLVHKFEEDRINKLTLGWFIAVVLYSLLVLKTVRTGESTGDHFIPIIGVNVATVMASIGLFVFVLFLNNISSYLKPKILVLRLVDQIICSIKPYEKRDIDEKSLLHIKDEDKTAPALLGSEKKDVEKLLEIRSREEGILRHIDWNSLSSSIKNLTKNLDHSHIEIEFYKSIGESIHKGNVLVTVYGVNSSGSNKSKGEDEKEKSINEQEYHENNLFNNNNTNNKDSKNKDKKQKNIIDDLEQKILSSIDVNKERDISNPVFGIDLLRSLAIKSASNNDIDVTNACITGLFNVLAYIWKNIDVFGLPFTIKVKTRKKRKEGDDEEEYDDNNEKNYSNKRKKILNDNNSSNIHDNENGKTTTTNTNTPSSKFKENKNDDNKLIIITIKPKEEPLTEVIFSDLSIGSVNLRHIHLFYSIR